MKLKKYASCILVLGLCFASSMNVSFANEDVNIDPTEKKAMIEKQRSQFNELDNKIREGRSQITQPNKVQYRSARSVAGNYPIKPGSILVTRDGILDVFMGHGGIVYNASTTVESYIGSGVGTYSNNWNSRYNTVYGAEVNGISLAQGQAAATYAYNQRGKGYNYFYCSPERTDDFYCSQLVYQAYKQTMGIDINADGGIVFPIDLILSNNTHTVYTQGV